MQIYTEHGYWPNDSYFKKWEIYNANSDYEKSSKPILNEVTKLQNLNNEKNKKTDFDENEYENKSIYSEKNLARKWDISHLIARASLKGIPLSDSIKEILTDPYCTNLVDTNEKKHASLGICNNIIPLKFDNVPKNNVKKMIGGIDLKAFEEHIIGLRKNDDSISILGYEYMSQKNKLQELRVFLETILEQRQDIYKTVYIIGQVFKKERMDVFGNFSTVEL